MLSRGRNASPIDTVGQMREPATDYTLFDLHPCLSLGGSATALDAAHRSSIYNKLVPILGEDDANVLMSEFPSVEAKELVTKEFLRAEIASFETRLTIRIGTAFGACTAILATLNLLG